MTSLVLLLLACEPDAGVSLSPQAWKERLQAVRPGEHDGVLEQLHLGPVTNSAWAAPTLEKVELLPADLTAATEPELLVRATFTSRRVGPDEGLAPGVRLERVQVLRREGKTWCALGADLSQDIFAETLNAGPADGMKDTWGDPTLELVAFSHPRQRTLRRTQAVTTFSRITSQGTKVDWWDVVDDRLVRRAEAEALEGRCAPCDRVKFRTWFEARGPAPVTLVRFRRECDEQERRCTTEEARLVPPTWQEPVTGD